MLLPAHNFRRGERTVQLCALACLWFCRVQQRGVVVRVVLRAEGDGEGGDQGGGSARVGEAAAVDGEEEGVHPGSEVAAAEGEVEKAGVGPFGAVFGELVGVRVRSP